MSGDCIYKRLDWTIMCRSAASSVTVGSYLAFSHVTFVLKELQYFILFSVAVTITSCEKEVKILYNCSSSIFFSSQTSESMRIYHDILYSAITHSIKPTDSSFGTIIVHCSNFHHLSFSFFIWRCIYHVLSAVLL